MSGSFVQLIAERLEISESEAREKLDALLTELRSRAQDQRVRVPDLGWFEEREGTLTFSPSPSLRRHINQRYEGLSPQPLPPKAEPAMEDGEKSESGASPPPAQRESDESPGTDTDSEPKERTQKASRERTLDSFHLILGILLLALLSGLGWFVFNQQIPLTSGRSSGADQSAVDTTDTTLAASASAGQQESEENPRTSSSPQQPTPSDDTSASTASPRDRLNLPSGGWTIVLASTANLTRAQKIREQYEGRFADSKYFLDVLPSQVDDTKRYRVVLDQFGSKDTAFSTLERLKDTLPEGAWVLSLSARDS